MTLPAKSKAIESKTNVAGPAKNTAPDNRQAIIGHSPALQQVYKLIGQVAPTSATVLITGESGTGKELVARAIYQQSLRANKPFIAINCAAIPENLLESELFGHEKGSFTGAHTQRIGKFEQCDKGTLFLDEIGDMPITTQTKVLRVLQDGEISRVGSNDSIKTDVRIIAATNKDLWQSVQRKEFREDLFYRLNVVRVQLPSLRERISDLPLLVDHFIRKYKTQNPHGPNEISQDALASLQRYNWPGNVRELENCIQRAIVLATGPIMEISNLPAEITNWCSPDQLPAAAATPPAGGSITLAQALDMLYHSARSDPSMNLLAVAEKELISRALAETGGNLVKAAHLLGLTRAAMRKRVERYGLQKEPENS